ncbi:polysaccharide export outer membrane protein [Roseomonas rosea]|uniref:Polysaccharide export outer membrane protein n=2 Tax=Muricoccus roseus TaxID=198092 RepID=A0A1M6N9K6_9PROT|nr:polysaccharide export outer membrane protein [Roseomonas rosea]
MPDLFRADAPSPLSKSRSAGRAARFRAPGSALALLLCLAACAPAAQPPMTAQRPAATEDASYVIGPGDTLGIFVYRAPELSVELPVRPDGRISMPLVPDIDAAGRTPTQLAGALQDRLREYVRDPNVTVMVRSFVGPSARMVRVIGEAAQPLALPYREGMTLLDVLIGARGLTRYAAGNRAEILRREGPDAAPRVIPVRLSALLRDGDISQDIPMRPGDTLVIPQSWF